MNAAYISSLILTLFCLGLIDYRLKLCIFKDWKRAFISIFTAWILLYAWDILAVSQGVFLAGKSQYTLGIFLLPEIPVEEILMLFLIAYTPLLTWTFIRNGKSNV